MPFLISIILELKLIFCWSPLKLIRYIYLALLTSNLSVSSGLSKVPDDVIVKLSKGGLTGVETASGWDYWLSIFVEELSEYRDLG